MHLHRIRPTIVVHTRSMQVKLSDLKPFKQPAPVEKEACASCEVFAPECLVPVGDVSVPMCWLCAHHVTAHDCAPHRANAAECECSPHEIYPNRGVPCVVPADLAAEIRERVEHARKAGDRANNEDRQILATVAPVREESPRRKTPKRE